MKKGLIIITIILCIISRIAKADIINNPTQAKAYIKDIDPPGGGMWLVNNNPGEEQRTINGELYDMVFTYNNNLRFDSMYVYYNWNEIFGEKILDFKMIYSVPLTGDTIYLWIENVQTEDINGTYRPCSVDNVEYIQYNSGRYREVSVRCPITTKLQNINVAFNSSSQLYNMNYLFYLKHDLIVREPTDTNELAEIQEMIAFQASGVYQMIRDGQQIFEQAHEHWEQQTPTGAWGGIVPNNTWEQMAHALEQSLFEYRNYEDWQNVNVNIDTNSSNWIWNIATYILNLDNRIMGLYISLLGIGLIRLVVG